MYREPVCMGSDSASPASDVKQEIDDNNNTNLSQSLDYQIPSDLFYLYHAVTLPTACSDLQAQAGVQKLQTKANTSPDIT